MPVVSYGWNLSSNGSEVQSTKLSPQHQSKLQIKARKRTLMWLQIGFTWWQSSSKCTHGGVLWIKFKINIFSLCELVELVQQNLKSWLEITHSHKERCLKHQWTLSTTHFSQRYYQVNGAIVICEDYEKYNSKSR